MKNEKLIELLRIAYRWGRDNGEGRSEKNFNDLLQTEAINQVLHLNDIHKNNNDEYVNGYKDGWRDCCKDVNEFDK